MKNALKYVGIVAICAAGTVSLLAHKPKDDLPAIVRDNSGRGYYVVERELRGPFYKVIKPWGENCIRTYFAGSNHLTHLYDNNERIKVVFYDPGFDNPVDTIDESVDAKSVQQFVREYRENRKMLREAGLLD